MLQKRKLFSFILACIVLITACGKKDNVANNSTGTNLNGTVYFSFAGEAGYYDLATDKYVKKMMPIGTASSRFDAFDISWDNKKIMLSMDVEGTFNFDERRVVIRNKTDNITYTEVQNGNNIADFVFEWGNISDVFGHLSPNEKYVAVNAQHFSDLPIAIIGVTEKDIIATWTVENVSLLDHGTPVWTSDNTLYFRIGNGFYKSSLSDEFKTAEKLLTFESGTSYVTVNPQGTKIAFRKNKHLWLANLDGTNLKQITTSETMDFIDYDGEQRPVFSPDGNYIAFTGASKRGTPWSDLDYPDGSWVAATGGKYGYIIIVPADGKQYNLEDKNSGAIWLRESNNSTAGIPCSGSLIWR